MPKSSNSSKSSKSTIDDYFEKTEELALKYGKRTVVLMQIGSFFEVYGKRNIDTGIIVGSNIEEVATICGTNIAVKSKEPINGYELVMAGGPVTTIERYTSLLVDNNYTCAVYRQIKEM